MNFADKNIDGRVSPDMIGCLPALVLNQNICTPYMVVICIQCPYKGFPKIGEEPPLLENNNFSVKKMLLYQVTFFRKICYMFKFWTRLLRNTAIYEIETLS